MKIVVIIPAYNEEKSIRAVLQDIPANLVSQVIVVDNGSTDRTAEFAKSEGAVVVSEPRRGYGSACLTGIEFAGKSQPDVAVFLDADYSDFPGEMTLLLDKVADGYDLVIGSRMLGGAQKGALLPQARFGNWLAVKLIRLFYGYKFTDLGPFRAVRWSALMAMKMQDRNFGWTVEMQVKAARLAMKTTEVPVRYRVRIGVSKVTGTLSGTLKAGYKILYTIFKYAVIR